MFRPFRAKIHRSVSCSVLAAFVLSLFFSFAAAADELAAVAASIAPAMEKLTAQYAETTGVEVEVSAAASGKLAKQIEQGAPFGLFLSANEKWARHLEEKELLSEVHPYAVSPIVLWWAKDTAPELDMVKKPETKVCIADPAVAPVGESAKKWLEQEGLYATLEKEGRLIIAGDILKVVLAVQNGGADVGIIPLGTALEAKGSNVRTPAPAQVYFGGLVTKNATPETTKFWEYLRAAGTDAAWQSVGFDPATR